MESGSPGWNTGGRHQRLGECFRRFDARRGLRRSEDLSPILREQVDDARLERSLGADNCQIDIRPLGECRKAVDIRCLERNAIADLRDARISRSADQLQRGIVRQELPCQGVLTAAAANQKDFRGEFRLPVTDHRLPATGYPKARSTSASRSSTSSTPHDKRTNPSLIPR